MGERGSASHETERTAANLQDKCSQPDAHNQEKLRLRHQETKKNRPSKASPQQQEQLFNSPARVVSDGCACLQNSQCAGCQYHGDDCDPSSCDDFVHSHVFRRGVSRIVSHNNGSVHVCYMNTRRSACGQSYSTCLSFHRFHVSAMIMPQGLVSTPQEHAKRSFSVCLLNLY